MNGTAQDMYAQLCFPDIEQNVLLCVLLYISIGSILLHVVCKRIYTRSYALCIWIAMWPCCSVHILPSLFGFINVEITGLHNILHILLSHAHKNLLLIPPTHLNQGR